MSAMTKLLVGRLVPDQLWALLEPLLPAGELGFGGADRQAGVESSQRLGRVRWKAERTIAWLLGAGGCWTPRTPLWWRPLTSPDYDRIQRIGEHARDHFRGGRMASEVDLGFEVQV
jgi:hypothetical protein